MKKSICIIITITVVMTAQVASALNLGLSGAKILSFEAGKLDYDKTGFGGGYSYRGTFSTRFVIGGQNPAEIELGVGLQYYNTGNPNGPIVPLIYIVKDNHLSDYFPFIKAQLNLPVTNFIKIPLGARFGAHIVNQTYRLYEIGLPNYRQESIKRNLFGTDFFTGLIVANDKFPIGAQIQVSLSLITDEFRSQAPFGVGTSAGLYIKF